MTAALTLAGSEHLDQVLKLVTAFHTEAGIELTQEARLNGVKPLLEGSPYGAIYLIGLPRAPIGYIAITFGWSIEFGGMDGFVDEVYVRPAVRGRGIAAEVLTSLPTALAQGGLKALHLEVDTDDQSAQRLYDRAGFVHRDRYKLMTLTL